MPLKSTILALNPTSYWPLDDAAGSSACLDAMGLTNADLPSAGVTLATIPFGANSAPLFDGEISPVQWCIRDPARAVSPPSEGDCLIGLGALGSRRT
jgi:hypothetical protein